MNEFAASKNRSSLRQSLFRAFNQKKKPPDGGFSFGLFFILFVFSGFVKEFINMEVDNALNDGEYGREYGAQ